MVMAPLQSFDADDLPTAQPSRHGTHAAACGYFDLWGDPGHSTGTLPCFSLLVLHRNPVIQMRLFTLPFYSPKTKDTNELG